MITAKLNELELMDGWAENDLEMRMRVDFPIFAATRAKSSAVIYFETEPGHHIGRHTDSAEEVLLILEGTAEAIVGDEQGRLSAGELALVPEMVPHDVYNVGDKTLKVLGFFSAAEVVSTFDEPVMPEGQRVVGTPPPEAFEDSGSKRGRVVSRILTVSPEEARGLRKLMVRQTRRQYGEVLPGIFEVLMPDLQVAGAAGWLYNRLHLRKGSPLSRLQREMLATVVNGLSGGAP